MFFPAKLISITKSGANLQFTFLCMRPGTQKGGGGRVRTVHKRKELVLVCELSCKYLNIPSHRSLSSHSGL